MYLLTYLLTCITKLPAISDEHVHVVRIKVENVAITFIHCHLSLRHLFSILYWSVGLRSLYPLFTSCIPIYLQLYHASFSEFSKSNCVKFGQKLGNHRRLNTLVLDSKRERQKYDGSSKIVSKFSYWSPQKFSEGSVERMSEFLSSA